LADGSIAPTRPAERINEIDIIRGLALFGILMVNMSFYKYPVFFERSPSGYPEGIEQFSAWFIQILFTGKFYAIFSFLFGLGFFIFMERTLAKGLELVPLYRRRLFALLAFGFIHLVIIWTGDILFTYALVGFILLGFRNKPLKSIRKWIIGLFIIALALNGLFGLLTGAGEYLAGDKYAVAMAGMIDGAIAAYRESSFAQLFTFRAINELPYVIISLIAWIPAVLAFFLCGLYAGKIGIFKNISDHRSLLKKIRNCGFPPGLFFLMIYFLIEADLWKVSILLRHPLLAMSNYTASIFLFPAYIATALLVLQTDPGKKILAPFAAAGRMALTNYLSQTLICVLLFYGFGFGLYAKVTVAEGILLTMAIFSVQIVWSNLWLRSFQYGPMEWFWRTLTYKKAQPLLNR